MKKPLAIETIINEDDCQIKYFPKFISSSEYQVKTYTELQNDIKWRQDKIFLFGKEHNVPRLQAWYADDHLEYTYSGLKMRPQKWNNTLLALKQKIETLTKLDFNSVLANLYRDGKDYVAWHSDDEPELGSCPAIASLSFGEERRFLFRKKSSGKKIEISPAAGSLILMKGATQHKWQHSIAKTSKKVDARINLTFRKIITKD